MANRGFVQLSRLVYGRVLLLCLAWSVVVGVGYVAMSPHSIRAGRLWDVSLSIFFLVWLNGILALALATLLFAQTEKKFSECCRLKLQRPESAISDRFVNCPMAGDGHSFCNLLERFTIGCFFVDRAGIVLDSNEEFAILRGRKSRTELIGKSVMEIVEPEDLVKAKAHLQRLIAGETVSRVYVRHWPDGTVHYHTAMGCSVRRDGAIVGAEYVVIDTTNHKKIEDRARRHLAELAQMQRINSMGKIVSELAHEIAQPLYAITNYAEACSDIVRSDSELQTDMLVNWMKQIAEQADRAASVVRRLRGYIHKSKPERVEVDLNHRIRNVLHLLDPGAREHYVDIEFHAAESLPSATNHN